MTDEQAIRNVIADGVSGDFIDVAHEVKKRYRIEVSTPRVEQVYRQMSREKAESGRAQISIDLSADPVAASSAASTESAPTPAHANPEADQSDQLANALRFVKSAGGLTRARQILDQLESMLKG